ncbi:hypothetical protein BGX34_007550 [Mortierella sp. NVP85]|nr:hypothetical protein BGX34_007550 [Mortierella sp. NVP85]
MAFALAGKYLYIQGGKTVRNSVDGAQSAQFFSLDLSQSWSTNSPPWRHLPNGTELNLHNGVAKSDNQTFMTFFQSGNGILVNVYNITQGTWATTITPTTELMQAIRTVCDPQTGLVYIDSDTSLVNYNPDTNKYTYDLIPAGYLKSRFFSGAVYNSGRRSIMYMGGITGSLTWEATTYITEYQIDMKTWSTFVTIGDLPTPRADHCMAASEDGNTIVMYGGRAPVLMNTTNPSNFTGSIYILDVPSKTWTQGPASSPRLYMTCIIVADQLLVWGGFNGTDTVDGTPVVFDLIKRQWVTSYNAPNYFLNLKARPSGSTSSNLPSPTASSESEKPTNYAAILGGTFGALFVISSSALVYLYMKRKSDRAKYGSQEGSEEGSQNTHPKPTSLDLSGEPRAVRNPQELKKNSIVSTGRDPQDGTAMSYFIPTTPTQPQHVITATMPWGMNDKDTITVARPVSHVVTAPLIPPRPTFGNHVPPSRSSLQLDGEERTTYAQAYPVGRPPLHEGGVVTGPLESNAITTDGDTSVRVVVPDSRVYPPNTMGDKTELDER